MLNAQIKTPQSLFSSLSLSSPWHSPSPMCLTAMSSLDCLPFSQSFGKTYPFLFFSPAFPVWQTLMSLSVYGLEKNRAEFWCLAGARSDLKAEPVRLWPFGMSSSISPENNDTDSVLCSARIPQVPV